MERATVIALVCIGPNCEMAKDGKLMYNLPSDMHRFKTITTLYPNMIIGRKTFDEEYFPLDDRFHLVLTNDKTHCPYIVPNVAYYNLDQIKQIIIGNSAATFCVIGGLSTYKALSSYVDNWIITMVEDPDITDGDYTIFPYTELVDETYREITRIEFEEIDKISKRKLKYNIHEYVRTNPDATFTEFYHPDLTIEKSLPQDSPILK